MSLSIAQLKESSFDFVTDSQHTFRILLDTLAFPGKVNILTMHELAVTDKQYYFILQLVLTLLDLETHYSVYVKDPEIFRELTRYIDINTGSKYQDFDQADYVLCLEAGLGNLFHNLKKGTLTLPHNSATVFYLAEKISNSPFEGGTPVTLKGPGIKTETIFYVQGVERNEYTLWKESRTSYPLGIDIFIVSKTGEIAGIPRSVEIITKGD